MLSAAEVCVVGGGPAGLIVAEALASHGVDVVVLESGGETHDSAAQELSRGTVTGDAVSGYDLVATRRRQLGGNANAWSVKTTSAGHHWTLGIRYGSLTDQDHESRSWIPRSGWPIPKEDLREWTRLAHERFGDGPPDFDEEQASSLNGSSADSDVLFDRGTFRQRNFRFGTRDRILDLRRRVESSTSARIITNATVTHLTQYRPQGPIDAVDFRTADGDRHTLRARLVVLACGAIENARLLLSSRTDGRQLGNEHDTVGRFLMDHPLFSMGTIRGNTLQQLSALSFFDFTNRGGALAHGHVVTTEAFCRDNESVQIGVCLFPRPADRHLRAVQAAQSVVTDPRTALASRSISASARNLRGGIGFLPQAAISSLLYRRSLLPGYGRGGWSRPGGPQLFDNVEVVFQCEQAPRASSRVTLSSEMDRFGSRLPSVHWELGTQTARSALIAQQQIHTHLKMTEFGTYAPRAGNFDELARPASLAHHIGTTRMSRHPRDGVVDPDCRVHTAPNLFIAGSSVFPTSSYVNPTLTIAALSLRIASTVVHDLRSDSVSS